MAPGGTLFRFAPHFGENVLRHGSHEWLPYSKNEVRLKSSNNNLSVCWFADNLIFQLSIRQSRGIFQYCKILERTRKDSSCKVCSVK